MKVWLLTGALSILVFSCSKKENSDIKTESSSEDSTAITSNVSGQSLMEASDCMACHNSTERMIGPSYSEIAAKYSQKDIEMLASKIIEGGSGVWGNVPMQSHPQVSKADAKKMAEHILSLKK